VFAQNSFNLRQIMCPVPAIYNQPERVETIFRRRRVLEHNEPDASWQAEMPAHFFTALHKSQAAKPASRQVVRQSGTT